MGIQVLQGEIRLNTPPGYQRPRPGSEKCGNSSDSEPGKSSLSNSTWGLLQAQRGRKQGFPSCQEIQRSEILKPGLAPGRPAGGVPHEGELLSSVSPPSAAPDNHRHLVNRHRTKQQEKKEPLAKGGMLFLLTMALLEFPPREGRGAAPGSAPGRLWLSHPFLRRTPPLGGAGTLAAFL